MVKTDWSDTRDVANDFFELGSGNLDQLRSYLFQKVPPLIHGQGFHQMLLGGGQYASKPNNHKIVDQMRVNILRPTSHELMFESRNALANRCFHLTLRLRGFTNFMVPCVNLLYGQTVP